MFCKQILCTYNSNIQFSKLKIKIGNNTILQSASNRPYSLIKRKFLSPSALNARSNSTMDSASNPVFCATCGKISKPPRIPPQGHISLGHSLDTLSDRFLGWLNYPSFLQPISLQHCNCIYIWLPSICRILFLLVSLAVGWLFTLEICLYHSSYCHFDMLYFSVSLTYFGHHWTLKQYNFISNGVWIWQSHSRWH